MAKYPKLRELKEAVTALIKGPCTTTFPRTPHTAMDGFRGKPTPSAAECIACGACAEVCPSRAIEVIDHLDRTPPTREVVWHYDQCIYCGQCERLCTTKKGVTLTKEYELSTADRKSLFGGIEHELVVCENCGTVVGPRPQLLWLLKKLGPLASGNFNLIYARQEELGIAEDASAGTAPESHQRAELYQILCPKCRHEVLVYNQTGKHTNKRRLSK